MKGGLVGSDCFIKFLFGDLKNVVQLNTFCSFFVAFPRQPRKLSALEGSESTSDHSKSKLIDLNQPFCKQTWKWSSIHCTDTCLVFWLKMFAFFFCTHLIVSCLFQTVPEVSTFFVWHVLLDVVHWISSRLWFITSMWGKDIFYSSFLGPKYPCLHSKKVKSALFYPISLQKNMSNFRGCRGNDTVIFPCFRLKFACSCSQSANFVIWPFSSDLIQASILLEILPIFYISSLVALLGFKHQHQQWT